ncbi:MAG: class I SAM-dependent methyltransferase [Bacteroidota bacterium]|nr:class I SAM-dependent methyltransferase [Bacteroidota bacterium]
MFELGTNDHWWEIAKRYEVLSNNIQTLKPLGYAHMISMIETFRPKTILEVGHGAGSFLFSIFTDNIELWGLDDTIEDSQVSKDELESIKLDYPQVKFVRGLLGNNIKELPDNYFDMVCSVSVLEHIPHENLFSAFAETYRILKPGGIASHSYDISYQTNTKPVFEAYEKNGFEWIKSRERMNVFWEEWLGNFDSLDLKELFGKILFENPMVVAESYMWQINRNNRPSPTNYLSVLATARKPFNDLTRTNESKNAKTLKSISPENFDEFTYSQKRHFDFFSDNKYDEKLYGYKTDIEYCNIKTYQDLLIYSYIINNIKNGSRILELGGNFPTVLTTIKKDYECWNLIESDESFKFLNESKKDINFINGKIGNLTNEIPDNNFDFVFSSSDLGDDDSDLAKFEKISNEINRILKPGGYALHCIISVWKEPIIWSPDILSYLFTNEDSINEFIPNLAITLDENLFFMTEKFYNDKWQPFTLKKYSKFGKPFSYNILYKKKRLNLV